MLKPTIILFYPATVPENHQRFSMPYALLYLERAIRDLNINVVIIDEDISPDYKNTITQYAETLLMVGVSCMTGRQLKGGIAFSQYIRDLFPHVSIVWGGWHPSVLPEETLRENFIDFVVHGQGEMPFRDLVLAIINKWSFSSIKGLAYKINGKIHINDRLPYSATKHLPAVNFDLIDINKYLCDGTLVYFASHGCIYECGFCAMSTQYKKKWFPKDITQIIDELIWLQGKTGFKWLNFQDDNFFVNRSFTVSLCKAIIDSGLKFEFVTSGHARNVLMFSDSDINLLYKAGCRKVYIGAESGSQKVLDLINKKDTVEDNFAVLKTLKKHQIITVFSTMVALPETPVEDVKMTLNMLRKGKLIDKDLETLIFYYTPFPETPLYALALAHGFKPPQNTAGWSNYTMFNTEIPWHKKHFRKKLEYFYNYYFPFYNKQVLNLAPDELKMYVRVFLSLFGRLNRWRFKLNFFIFPFEARLMLYFVKRYNRTYGKRFCFSGTWSFYENRYF
ncbi:MAG: Radical SAM superfamily protein [Bacteroidetes bacterium ADurb.Bin408]|nr:MAG: Radical SAM superfamily protein [Bacteroidetes bacterium ADurb.Bin408]